MVKRQRKEAAPDEGTLTITSTGRSKIRIDGIYVGETPITVNLKVGKHFITETHRHL
jgi:hypothetical protein